MSNAIAPVSNEALLNAMREHKVSTDYADMVGRMLTSDRRIIKIVGFIEHERSGWHCQFVEYNSHGQAYSDGRVREYTIDELKRFLPLPSETTPENIGDLANKAFADPSIIELDDGSGDSGPIGGTAVATASNAEQVGRMAKIYQERTVRVAAMRNLIRSRMEEVSSAVHQMQERTNYLKRVLAMMQSYAGIYEEIVQIRDGNPASMDTPLYIIQATRYMDEEVGSIHVNRNGQRGIDFSSVNVFDEWIAQPENLDLIAPWKRCIIGFQASRQTRHYSDNPIVQMHFERENKMLYLLIRNGDKLYRIYSGNLTALETLIPTTDEWAKIMKDVQNDSEYHRLQAKASQMSWTQRVMLLQGLLHRTDILNPLPHDDIDLFKERDYEVGHVVLHRDFEYPAIDNGREKFIDWVRRINNMAERGTRVYLSSAVRGTDKKERNTRYKNEWACECPEPGVYEVQYTDTDLGYGESSRERRLIIYFLPQNEIFDSANYKYKKRTTRDGFVLYGHEYDVDLWINYDELTLEDLRYHVANRAERKGYLQSLPLLTKLLAELVDEQREENEFIGHICRVEGLEETAVREAVEWWKRKNIWKRPIKKDVDKAWRMIRRRAKGKQ